MVQLILFHFKLAFHFVVFFLKLDALHFIFFFQFIQRLFLSSHHVPLRFDLILKGDLRALELRNLVHHQLVLLN